MHRYQPRIHLVYVEKGCEIPVKSLRTLFDLENYDYRTFSFPECAFYSVTAYQNQLVSIYLLVEPFSVPEHFYKFILSLQIIKLKIDCNPFARGFRDSTCVFTDMERER